jgi:hypothetical protein
MVLAWLVAFFGTDAFLESAAMQTMHGHGQGTKQHHEYGANEWVSKTNSKNQSDKKHFHEHCQFCFAPALASGTPSSFSISRLKVVQTLKLGSLHRIIFRHHSFELAAPRAPPIQTGSGLKFG